MIFDVFLENAEFMTGWNSYKFYLEENGYKMDSEDYEREELFKLFMISGQNTVTAIFILNKIMAGSFNCI